MQASRWGRSEEEKGEGSSVAFSGVQEVSGSQTRRIRNPGERWQAGDLQKALCMLMSLQQRPTRVGSIRHDLQHRKTQKAFLEAWHTDFILEETVHSTSNDLKCHLQSKGWQARHPAGFSTELDLGVADTWMMLAAAREIGLRPLPKPTLSQSSQRSQVLLRVQEFFSNPEFQPPQLSSPKPRATTPQTAWQEPRDCFSTSILPSLQQGDRTTAVTRASLFNSRPTMSHPCMEAMLLYIFQKVCVALLLDAF